MTRFVCVVFALSAFVGCSSRRPQVIIDISSDTATDSIASWLRIQVWDTEGNEARTELLRAETFPVRVPLVARDDDPQRSFDLDVQLFTTLDAPDADSVPVAEVSAQANYVEDEVVYIVLRFSQACLEGQLCADGQTCYRGECRGACFAPTLDDELEETEPLCGRCDVCRGAQCVIRDDEADCGCPGDRCRDGVCVGAASITSLSSGLRNTCAVLGSDLYCWGNTSYLELGVPADGDALRPIFVRSGVALVATNGNENGAMTAHSCAVDLDGTVSCWGQNGSGQLGVPDADAQETPLVIPRFTEETIVKLVAGGLHNCALTDKGELWCWGGNNRGQLGIGDSSMSRLAPLEVPPPGDSGWTDVALGQLHTCAVSAGRVYCWGFNFNLEVGVDVAGQVDSPTPIEIDPELEFDRVACGAFHSCALTTGGRAYCWGGNGFGNLGRDTGEAGALPAPVNGDLRFQSISCGRSHSCGLVEGGVPWCWGRNENGELGTGSDTVDRLRPIVTTGPVTEWTSIALGEQHSCAVRNDDFLWCWGRNNEGRLGLGDTDRRLVPTPICFSD